FFHEIVDDRDIIRNIGEFYFQKDHYKEALEIFLPLSEKDSGNELFEKIAYCYQSMGDFERALDFYKKAELLSEPRTWLFNRIAFCLRKIDDYEEAIHYYGESEKLDPENLYIQTSLGQVYMEKEDFDEALKYFFKVEYLSPENIKVHRPIAWCSFVLGKNETAKKYFEKIVLKEGNKYDYMNLGHVYWSLGDKIKAIENYRHSIKKSDMDFLWFAGVMKEDTRYLLNYGIQAFDIPLMLDYLRMSG
ncbi:MAG: tetratricopeptide repeat protein, partial [Bacteroidales bacterium]|nr:tetratricopeptide repeat protein [Bacteroidales bacterium]